MEFYPDTWLHILCKEDQRSQAVPLLEFNLVNGGKPYKFVLKMLNSVDDVVHMQGCDCRK